MNILINIFLSCVETTILFLSPTQTSGEEHDTCNQILYFTHLPVTDLPKVFNFDVILTVHRR